MGTQKFLLVSGWATVAIAAALALVVGLVPSADAQVKPGDFITPANASKVKDLLSPGEYWRVANGMSMKIVPTGRIDWPPPYKEATEKYSSQVRLAKNGLSMVGYVAGQPFPIIDDNDPNAAIKIMWNMDFRPMWTDDFDARYFGCVEVYEKLNNPYNEIDFQLIGHYGVYNEVGRTEVEPLPTDPDYLRTNIMFRWRAFPWLSPAAIRGSGIVGYRYGDPKRADDSWSYNPDSRRVRRLDEAIRGDATGTLQFNQDDAEGYNPKIEDYTYRFLGEKMMLGALHVAQDPGNVCPTDGGGSVCPAEWEMRRVYVIETKANPKRLTGDLYSKHLVYIDTEADVVLSHDQYDRQGELMLNFTNWLTYRDRPVPDARIAIYPFKRVFQVNGTSTNIQTGLSSFCDLPTPNAPEHECWYINMGAVSRDDVTPDAMVKNTAGR
ncbi:MAG: DUF1329 domain-containing protein [Candidatus Binataceae bacterium]